MPPAADAPILEIDGLTLRRDGTTLVAGLDLSLAAGEHVLLRGPSGSGKTTLLRCLLGFAGPEAGRIRIAGEELGPGSVWRLRRGLAYVAQEPDLGEGTVADCRTRVAGLHANAGLDPDLLPDLLDELGLPAAIRDRRLEDCSGGERQRVALAIALWLERPLVILDEPAAALDEDSREAVIAALRRRGHLAVLAVAHGHRWTEVADRVVDLADRRPVVAPPEPA